MTTATFKQRIHAKYKVMAAAYDLSDYSDSMDVEAEITDYVKGSPGGWHEPASGSEMTITVSAITLDGMNEMETGDVETFTKLKNLKAGDKVKVNCTGSVDDGGEGDNIQFKVESITIKKTEHKGDLFTMFCDEDIQESGMAPSQSFRGWEKDL